MLEGEDWENKTISHDYILVQQLNKLVTYPYERFNKYTIKFVHYEGTRDHLSIILFLDILVFLDMSSLTLSFVSY